MKNTSTLYGKVAEILISLVIYPLLGIGIHNFPSSGHKGLRVTNEPE
jgi:hypothetical protein